MKNKKIYNIKITRFNGESIDRNYNLFETSQEVIGGNILEMVASLEDSIDTEIFDEMSDDEKQEITNEKINDEIQDNMVDDMKEVN